MDGYPDLCNETSSDILNFRLAFALSLSHIKKSCQEFCSMNVVKVFKCLHSNLSSHIEKKAIGTNELDKFGTSYTFSKN